MQLLFDMSRDVLYVQREDGYQPGQLGNRTVQTTRPYWISEKHEIIFEIGKPIEQRFVCSHFFTGRILTGDQSDLLASPKPGEQ